MKKTLKSMDESLMITKIFNDHFKTESTNNPLIGAICRFIITPENRKEMGSLAATCKYEIVATQRLWGYDEKGRYTMIDGFRVMRLDDDEDRFGRPAAPYDIEILSTLS